MCALAHTQKGVEVHRSRRERARPDTRLLPFSPPATSKLRWQWRSSHTHKGEILSDDGLNLLRSVGQGHIGAAGLGTSREVGPDGVENDQIRVLHNNTLRRDLIEMRGQNGKLLFGDAMQDARAVLGIVNPDLTAIVLEEDS